MKVALIIPENSIIDIEKLNNYNWENMREYQARKRLWSCPSLSLLTVGAMFTSDFEIDYVDLNFSSLPNTYYDIVLFSPSTSQADRAYDLADYFREKGTTVVMGGVHVSILSEEALKHSDAVFIGESEEVFNIFLEDIKNNRLKKIYKADNVPNLKSTPIPKYELAKKYKYKSVPIQTSRGCPHQCEFCVSSTLYGKKYRRKSIEQVKSELLVIKEIWTRPFVFFTDDNMFMDEEYTSQILNLLEQLSIRWYAFSDASIADKPHLLDKMYKSGCCQLLIGFESLSENNLAKINKSKWKRNKRKDYKKIIEVVQSFGIGVVGSFVLGFDEDNSNTFDQLYEFILDTCLYATNITILTPFPGTKMYERYKKLGRISTEEWKRYNGFELIHNLENFTSQDFEKAFKDLYVKLNSEERIIKVLTNFKDIIRTKTKETLRGCE